MKNIISINDFSGEEIFDHLLKGCENEVKTALNRNIKLDWSKKVTFAFFEPSTRTRGSYVEAARLLGMNYYEIIGEEATSLMKKESMANTARMLAVQGADILVMRTKIEGTQKFINEILEDEGYNVSVQNAGDGTNQHPTQTMLDLLTISRNFNRLDDFTIGFLGDLKYGRTVHSLLSALSYRDNISTVFVSDPATALQDNYKQLFGNVEEGESLELLADCDIIYVTRLQEERFTGDPMSLARAREKVKIDNSVLKMLKDNVILMHPMPYVQEFHPSIRGDERIIIDDQAWCGIPTRIFLLREGYENRRYSMPNGSTKGKMKTVEKSTLDEYWQRRKKMNKTEQYFSPIHDGTVIDHISIDLGIKISNILSSDNLIKGKGVEHLIKDKNPGDRRLNKEIIIIDGDYPKEEIMIDIASLDPGVTFNIIRDGLFTKQKLENPSLISGIGKCPNEACITRWDPEAQPKFKANKNDLSCYYCEKQFQKWEVI